MPSPANTWPALSTMLRNMPHSLNERISNAKHSTDRLLDHIDKNQARAPRALIDFVKSIQDLASDTLKYLISKDWQKAIDNLYCDMQQIKQDVIIIKIQTEPVWFMILMY